MKKLYKNTLIFLHEIIRAHWPLLAVLLVFSILRIATIQHHDMPSWDASVYVGMGKYLYSHGASGTWESLRPVGLPIILGAFWKIGIDPYAAGEVFSFFVSVSVLVLVYAFAERIYKRSGAIAAALLAGTSIFFGLSAIPVTDITATFFALLSLFLVYKARKNVHYFIAGIAAAIGFMFRFPHGLMLAIGAVAIGIKIFYEPTVLKLGKAKNKLSERIVTAIEHGFSLGGGFFLIVVPYLISNYIFYHNAFLPFIEGTAVIKLYPSLYQKGPWFYPWELLKANPLYAFALVPIGLLWKRAYRTMGIFMLSAAVIFIAGYFTHEGHKEARYMMAFLPYVAILAAAGITYMLDYCKLPQLLFFGLFLIGGFMVNARYVQYLGTHPDTESIYRFNTYLTRVPHPRIIATTPAALSYSDAFMVRNLYSDWNDAYMAYNMFKDQADYILLNSCSLETGCADDARCKDSKQVLLNTLAAHDTQVFSETTSSQCALSIYKIAH